MLIPRLRYLRSRGVVPSRAGDGTSEARGPDRFQVELEGQRHAVRSGIRLRWRRVIGSTLPGDREAHRDGNDGNETETESAYGDLPRLKCGGEPTRTGHR
jgi:hypothetical protein